MTEDGTHQEIQSRVISNTFLLFQTNTFSLKAILWAVMLSVIPTSSLGWNLPTFTGD